MRVIVTEKGQDLRKEFFMDKINGLNQQAEENYLKGGLSTHSMGFTP